MYGHEWWLNRTLLPAPQRRVTRLSTQEADKPALIPLLSVEVDVNLGTREFYVDNVIRSTKLKELIASSKQQSFSFSFSTETR